MLPLKAKWGNTKYSHEIKDTIWLIALQGLNYVMPLVVFPYLMVVLGAEKFGYIGFSISVTQYLMLIVDFGFNLTATKEVALHKDNQEKLCEIFWSVTAAKVLLLLVSFILLIVLAYCIPQFSIYRSTMLVCFLMVFSIAFSYVWYFQGLGKIRIISIINTLSKLFILPLCFLFVKTQDDYLNAALIQAGIYISGTFFTILFLLFDKHLPNLQWRKPKKLQVIHELQSGWPVFLSGAASSLYVLLFAVILGYFSTPEEVGKYTAAEKIIRSFCYLIFLPVSQAFFPKISAMSQNKRGEAQILIRRISLAVTVIMTGVFLLLFFFSDHIMLFLGKDYHGIEQIFRIMAILPLFISLGGIFGQLGLLALGDERDKKHYQNVYFISGAVALVTIAVLVPGYHSTGAATALLITEFVSFALLGGYSRRLLLNTDI